VIRASLRVHAGWLACIVLVVFAGAARADDPQDIARRVSENIMSPFCDGVTLHDCPSDEADELRRRIESMARAGATEDEIISTLAAEYGDRIRANPSSPVAWIVPTMALVVGVVAIAVLSRRWIRPTARDDSPLDPQARARIDAELSSYRDAP
jgi:cytochrome c-type biogenesis protein CcmH/NrfF